jgi:hypothetical protein
MKLPPLLGVGDTPHRQLKKHKPDDGTSAHDPGDRRRLEFRKNYAIPPTAALGRANMLARVLAFMFPLYFAYVLSRLCKT